MNPARLPCVHIYTEHIILTYGNCSAHPWGCSGCWLRPFPTDHLVSNGLFSLVIFYLPPWHKGIRSPLSAHIHVQKEFGVIFKIWRRVRDGKALFQIVYDVRRSDSVKVVCPSYQVFSGHHQREELSVISNLTRLCLWPWSKETLPAAGFLRRSFDLLVNTAQGGLFLGCSWEFCWARKYKGSKDLNFLLVCYKMLLKSLCNKALTCLSFLDLGNQHWKKNP